LSGTDKKPEDKYISWKIVFHSILGRVKLILSSIEQPGVCYIKRREYNLFTSLCLRRTKKQMVRAKSETFPKAEDPKRESQQRN
jgi:hypothetical protein